MDLLFPGYGKKIDKFGSDYKRAKMARNIVWLKIIALNKIETFVNHNFRRILKEELIDIEVLTMILHRYRIRTQTTLAFYRNELTMREYYNVIGIDLQINRFFNLKNKLFNELAVFVFDLNKNYVDELFTMKKEDHLQVLTFSWFLNNLMKIYNMLIMI